jgi:hypothetical protein
MPLPNSEPHLTAVSPRLPVFTDRVSMDLATARLFDTRVAGFGERVRRELITICDVLVRSFPGAGVVLTGSLFAGEGSTRLEAGEARILSDYDFFVVSPSFMATRARLAGHRLADSMGGLPLSTRLEIGLVWEPLLRWGQTTIGGAVVGGWDIGPLLAQLPAPSAHSALLQAYRALSAAPLHPECYAWLCSKGLARAAHAFLLDRCRGLPRHAWIGLSSVPYVKAAILPYGELLGVETVRAVAQACDFIGGADEAAPVRADHARFAALAGRMAEQVVTGPSRLFALKHFFWLCRERRSGFPRPDAGLLTLRGLRALAEAWSQGPAPATASLETAGKAARGICFTGTDRPASDRLVAYAQLRSILSSLAGFKPYALSFGPPAVIP